MTRTRKRLSSRWIKIFLSATLLVILFRHSDLGELSLVLARTQPGWAVAALVGYLFSQALCVRRWQLLAAPLGFTCSYARYFVYYFSGMYLNLFAPSTVAGDVGRALFLAAGQQRRALAMTTVLADRGIGFVALVWVGAAAVLLLPGDPVPRALYWSAVIAPPATAALWLLGSRVIVRFLAPHSWWRRLVERDLTPYWNDYHLLGQSFTLACVFHLVQIATQILAAGALGLQIPWTFFLIFVPIVNVAGMLPISLSGVGVREAGYWYFLSLIGVDREPAIALGLLSSAIVLASNVIGAPVFLLRKRPVAADTAPLRR
ncbi:MAG: hypothetical protein A3J75_00295 [Acidobacteria bacterium RBG_16_68_9]|nr:MAG: hypothetical protein A3J75_00295 [Acidobacteria bacterium RBG_16_68_9]